jgi:uncharacterized protein with HEPN domain
MKSNSFKFLQDILDSISKIEHHLQSIKTFNEYSKNLTVIDAVERRLVIIGEALSKVSKTEKTISLTDQNKIIGLRHILVHDYDMIDNASIWKICNHNLEILKKEVTEILDN